MIQIKINNNFANERYCDELPDICPYCHKGSVPLIQGIYIAPDLVHLFLSCPVKKCMNSFIAYYSKPKSGPYIFTGVVSEGQHFFKDFDEVITSISPDFAAIYNEAYLAEQHSLHQIWVVSQYE